MSKTLRQEIEEELVRAGLVNEEVNQQLLDAILSLIHRRLPKEEICGKCFLWKSSKERVDLAIKVSKALKDTKERLGGKG